MHLLSIACSSDCGAAVNWHVMCLSSAATVDGCCDLVTTPDSRFAGEITTLCITLQSCCWPRSKSAELSKLQLLYADCCMLSFDPNFESSRRSETGRSFKLARLKHSGPSMFADSGRHEHTRKTLGVEQLRSSNHWSSRVHLRSCSFEVRGLVPEFAARKAPHYCLRTDLQDVLYRQGFIRTDMKLFIPARASQHEGSFLPERHSARGALQL